MNLKSRWIKIAGFSLLIGGVLGVAIPGARLLFAAGADRLVKNGEDTYAKGIAAEKDGDAAKAAARFDEANLQASKALDAVVREQQQPKNQDDEARTQLAHLEGQALWLKARALRDHYFAKGIADGQPLPETADSTTGAKFRSVHVIPDAEARGIADVCLREAGRRLTDVPEVQTESLRNELMRPALAWNLIEKLAKQILTFNPKDTRALYLLARFEFEQPPTDGRAPMLPIPPAKRSRDRIMQAREHVKQLKAIDGYPLWRTLFLEAEIVQWLRDDAATHSSPKRRDQEDAALRSMLLSSKNVLAQTRNGEGMERLSRWDMEGLLGLHLMALDLAVEDSRQPRAVPDKVVELLATTIGLCRQLADKNPAQSAECALSAIQALSKAETALVSEPPPDWKKDVDFVQDLTRKARDRKVARPDLYEAIAGLLAREAYLEGKRGNRERRNELNKQALQWVEDGLRLGAEAKLSAVQLVGLNTLAAEMKAISGAKPEQIAPYLTALKEAKTPRATSLAALLEAAAAEREGRLDQARKQLEQVLTSEQGDLILRAHMVLGSVYLALGQPDKALLSLQQVERAYKVFDQLSQQEKAWALEFFRGPEDLALLMVAAHVDSALNKARSFVQRNPGKPFPVDMLRHHEIAIATLRKKFQHETPQDRRVRQMMAVYYSFLQQKDKADKELADLHSFYPNNVDVLRIECNLLMSARDASGKPRDQVEALKEADGRIEQFIKDHPSDVDARFYWVEWLARTRRADEALAYLQSPANFADMKNDRYQRVLAATLLAKGDRAGSQKALQYLPHDAGTDALLIQTASTADRDKLVEKALARHESKGLFQTWQGVLAYDKRDYPAAAEAFLRASQYTNYQATAKRGLQQSLFTLAQSDPAKARNLAARMMKESADEPLLLLASAYASLMLDDIGAPNDKPDRVKSMAATLNAWEQMIVQQQPQARATAPLTRAAYWSLAGRQDVALSETARALSLDAKNDTALRQAIALALELRDPALASETRKRLDALKKLQPDKPEPMLLQAQFDEFNEKPADAIKIYEALLKKDPKLTAAYIQLHSLLIKQGEKDKALAVARRWREALPDDLLAAQAEVRGLAETKQVSQARQLADAVIDEQMAKERKRLEAVKPAADADPKTVEKDRQAQLDQAHLNLRLRMILALKQAKAWTEAESWLNQILAKQPDLEAALILLGDAYVSQSSWEKASKVYEKVLMKNKNNVAAANNLAWMLAKHLNNSSDALRIVQELRKGRFSQKPITGDRLRPEFLDTLGVVYVKANKGSLYPEMRDVFEAASQRFPRDPRMYLYLGQAYAGLLDTDKAERLYATAAEIAKGEGRKFLTPEKCKEVLGEIESAQKKLKQTALR